MPGIRMSVTITSNGLLREHLERLGAAADEGHVPFVARGAQRSLKALQNERLVVYEQDALLHWIPSPTAGPPGLERVTTRSAGGTMGLAHLNDVVIGLQSHILKGAGWYRIKTLMHTTLEREIKLRVRDATVAREAIIRIGATPLRGRRLQEDCLLDAPNELLRGRRSVLRIRIEQGRALCTFKGPVQPSRMKLREERETVVSDGETLLYIFRQIGFEVWFRYEKYREELRSGRRGHRPR